MQSRIFLFLLLSLSFQTVFSQFQNQMLSSMGSTSETSSGIIATQTIVQSESIYRVIISKIKYIIPE